MRTGASVARSHASADRNGYHATRLWRACRRPLTRERGSKPWHVTTFRLPFCRPLTRERGSKPPAGSFPRGQWPVARSHASADRNTLRARADRASKRRPLTRERGSKLECQDMVDHDEAVARSHASADRNAVDGDGCKGAAVSPAHTRARIETVVPVRLSSDGSSPAHTRARIETKKPTPMRPASRCRPLTRERGSKHERHDDTRLRAKSPAHTRARIET